VFHSRTDDEIVSAGGTGGRTTFRNAGTTRRYGAELQADVRLARQWALQAAYTYLNAEFREGEFAGRMLPGLSKQHLFVGLNYRPAPAWRLGVSAQHAGKVYVNDANSEAAPAFTIASASVGYTRQLGDWTLNAFARVDNLFDRQYVGSVIVNDGNSRYYESAPGRNWATGVSLRYNF
jgi:iron complex outermembrane receptor protein